MTEHKERIELPAATADTLTQPLFRGLSAENIEELETSVLESVCMSCFKNVNK